MVNKKSVQLAWTKAVLEGMWSTAAYLEPDLPEVEINLVRPSKEDSERRSSAAKGEFKTRF